MITEQDGDAVECLLERAEAELLRVDHLLDAKPQSPEKRRWLLRQAKLRAAVVGLQALRDLQKLDEQMAAGDTQWPPRDLRGRFIEGFAGTSRL
jgi:gamma-glutamyl:cysteine ligase YbdK (ATP-grasp superfamily)